MDGERKTKQSEINQLLRSMCDSFRRIVGSSRYIDYILMLLLLKYISDVCRDRDEECHPEVRNESERMKHKRVVLPEGSSFYNLYEQRSSASIGKLINNALELIREHPKNEAELDGVFLDVDFSSRADLGKTKDRNQLLKKLLEDFNKPELDLRPSQVSEDSIGNAFIYLLEQSAISDGKKLDGGDFMTPIQVSTLVAKLVQPNIGDRICDPVCGTGSLLIRVAHEIKGGDHSLYGQEMNRRTWALARMNMLFHGYNVSNIKCGNTLDVPQLVDEDGELMKFDVVVANPPFSSRWQGGEKAASDTRFWRGVPPKSKGDYAFITHVIESVLPRKGRAAVLVPHGVLFREFKEGLIRKALIEENLLDAVVGLPPNLFPHTSIPVAILIFDRSREEGGKNESRRDVIFIDASNGFQSAKARNILSDKHIDRIVSTFKTRESVDKYARVTMLEEVAENDFNLNISRYVDTFEEEEETDIAEMEMEIERLKDELSQTRQEMKNRLRELGLIAHSFI